ncbi:MAG: glutamate--tRNA ligase [Deltaproteobacteria bacterium]|nr:glutamate--tRNA ligase [Deltaproteobacteria bacterium]
MISRYRFAPSPTGHLHIGGARTALYNYLLAKKTGGVFILRIEDTDRERSTQEYVDSILSAMDWLGLKYDEGPFYQSERSKVYQAKLEELLKTGKAYRCFCTAEEIQNKREAAMKAGLKPKYDGTCRLLDPHQTKNDPRPYCIRFKSPETGETLVQDLIRGEVSFANAELDDLIIARTDGSPTYNFVVVVDDVENQITHVIRGDDHLNNTPRQIQLYEALHYPVPQFAHLPMILGPDKKRLSKRHGATSVLAYQEAGYLPQALLNYLVRLGWSYGDEEIFSLNKLEKIFDLKNVGKSAAVFNTEKLLWLNGYWIRQLKAKELLEAAMPFLKKLNLEIKDSNYAQQALASCQEKVKTLVELAEMAKFYFVEKVEADPKAKEKTINPESLKILEELKSLLESLADFKKENLETHFKRFAENKNLKLGKIAQPLRFALTGSLVSPGIYDMLEILGKDQSLKRIQNALG